MNKLQVTVGQELALVDFGTGRYEPGTSFGWVVSRVTPAGKFEAQRGKEETKYFNAKGFELAESLIGVVKNYGYEAKVEVADWQERVRSFNARRDAAAALNAISNNQNRVLSTYSKEAMLEQIATIEALLVTARAAVEAI